MTATEALAAQTPQRRAGDGEASVIGGAEAKLGGGLVVAGDASVARRGAGIVVRQRSAVAVIAFDELSLKADAALRLEQPSAAALTVLVVRGGSASTLAGRLEAPGRVVLSNPHGVVFAPGAQVVVAGLVAAAHELENASEVATCDGWLRFGGGAASAAVENAGAIRAAEAGFVALVGPQVRQSGTIVALLGRVELAACAGLTVTPDAGAELIGFGAGDELSAIVGDGSVGLVVQTGRIAAAGGTVALTAQATDAVANASIEVSHVVKASSASGSGGAIRLQGPGEVRVVEGGRVEAAGALGGGRIAVEAGRFVNAGLVAAEGVDGAGRAVARGGRIDIVADHVGLAGKVSVSGASGGRLAVTSSGLLSLAERVEAEGLAGVGGQVLYRAGRVVETASGATDASGTTDGGAVSVVAQTDLMSSGRYLAAGGSGSGGRIDVTAADVRLLSARLTAPGPRQGGMVRVGGAFQGGKAVNASRPAHAAFVGRWGKVPGLAAARNSFVNDNTAIDVSSAAGVGGTAVIWSDAQTTFLGGIAATGKAGGGAVEISSAGTLRQAQLLKVEVGDGHLLLDPKNITVGAGAAIQGWAQQTFDLPRDDESKKDDRCGASVALNDTGTRMAVGAPQDNGHDNSAQNAGAVYLFSLENRDVAGATLIGMIGKGYKGGDNVDVDYMEELKKESLFGASVALSADGTHLAVGAPQDNGHDNSTQHVGAVYLFSFKNGDFGGGTLAGIIGKGYTGGTSVDTQDSVASHAHFGSSVALSASGRHLAVGAPQGDSKGTVYLFSFGERTFGHGAPEGIIGHGYTDRNSVDVKELESNDSFGASVALSADGDHLAVGALNDGGHDKSVQQAGAVYLFSFKAYDVHGNRAFEGGRLTGIIGKGYTGDSNVDVGELNEKYLFGGSVALDATGRHLAVGAEQDNGHDKSTSNAGAVYLFSFENGDFGGGRLTGIIGKGYTGEGSVDLPLRESHHFGRSVALTADGAQVVVVHAYSGAQSMAGVAAAVYLFTRSCGQT